MDLDISDDMDAFLVDMIVDHPTLYDKHKYTAADEVIWNRIAGTIGVQSKFLNIRRYRNLLTLGLFLFRFPESCLKKRWHTIRDDHQRISIYNRTHTEQVEPHRLSNHLHFVPIDVNRAEDIDFRDLEQIQRGEIIHIEESILDEFDPYPNTTIDSFVEIKNGGLKQKATDNSGKLSNNIQNVQETNKNDEETERLKVQQQNNRRSAEKIEQQPPIPSNNRDEDDIFGELVVAMLKKLDGDDKKRAKKEIMNILF